MEVETQPVDVNELADNCDELDDDFFNTIGLLNSQFFDEIHS